MRGVDCVFIRQILDANDPAGIFASARAPSDDYRLNLDPLLVDLFRHYEDDGKRLDFLIGTSLAASAEDVSDDLILAFLPFGARGNRSVAGSICGAGRRAGRRYRVSAGGPACPRSADFRLIAGAAGVRYRGWSFSARSLYGDLVPRAPRSRKCWRKSRRKTKSCAEKLPTRWISSTKSSYPTKPGSFDILREYPERDLPAFDLLTEPERLEMLFRPAIALVRASAARSFFNAELNAESRAELLRLAAAEIPSPAFVDVAWESLADSTRSTAAIRGAMIAALNDESLKIRSSGRRGRGALRRRRSGRRAAWHRSAV